MMHSFTPDLNGARRPWHAGVLWDREDGRMALPPPPRPAGAERTPGGGQRALRRRLAARLHDAGPRRPARARANVQIEVRQDLVADEPGIERWSGILIEALAGVLADPSLYERR